MTFPGTPLISVNITPEAITAISTTMVVISQLIKWAGVDTKHAPPILAANSLLIVLLWVFMPSAFQIIAAAALVMVAASGVYGFATRQGSTPNGQPPQPAPDAPPVGANP